MDYKARYYSSLLGRFIQPDSIIPGAGNPQALNRYSYTTNNPINFNDPSGHRACDEEDCLEYFKYGTGKNSKPTTPKALLDGGYQDTQAMLRAYVRANPRYEAMRDPELVNDRSALSFVAIAQSQVSSEKNNSNAKNGMFASIIDGTDFALGYGELFGEISVPQGSNILMGAWSQSQRDKNGNYTAPEKTIRALVAGLENGGIGGVAFLAATGAGIVGLPLGPGDLALVVTVFTGTYLGLTGVVNYINNKIIFPHINQMFGNQPQRRGPQIE